MKKNATTPNSNKGVPAYAKRFRIIYYIAFTCAILLMVKNFIRSGNIAGKDERDPFGRSTAPLKAVNKKAALPSEEEIANNTRARSAKLRVAEKINPEEGKKAWR